MKRLTFKEYTTPSVEVLSIVIEKGFIVSNPDWSYGDQGEAGTITEGESYDL